MAIVWGQRIAIVNFAMKNSENVDLWNFINTLNAFQIEDEHPKQVSITIPLPHAHIE